MSDTTPRDSEPDQPPARPGRRIDPRLLWPVLIVVLALAIFALLQASRPNLAPVTTERKLTAVRVTTVHPAAVQLTVRSQGTVKPLVESNLIPEVSGRVVWLSPALVSGGNFEKGELLLRIDDQDYRNAVERSEARVQRAEVDYELAEAEYQRQVRLLKQKLSSQSQLDQAKRAYRVAEANMGEMRIELRRALADLERTKLHAAFSGRVRSESVDIGQFVSRGEIIASLYATDTVEVRLPIANRQFAYLDLPANTPGMLPPEQAPGVLIKGEYAGRQFEWQSSLVRMEAEIDASTRMFYGVASVDNSGSISAQHPPLVVGLFVSAEIEGSVVEGVFRLPRTAMRGSKQVLVVDDEDRVHFRDVVLLRMEHDEVLISEGLQAGERICISPLQVAVEGMQVLPVDVTPQSPE